MEFNSGNTARCINVGSCSDELTLGKNYIVLDTKTSLTFYGLFQSIVIINDKNQERVYAIALFTKIP